MSNPKTATKATETIDEPVFDKAQLKKLYDRFFDDHESPEETLANMMHQYMISNPNPVEVVDFNMDYLVLTGFFTELFKPIRTTSAEITE